MLVAGVSRGILYPFTARSVRVTWGSVRAADAASCSTMLSPAWATKPSPTARTAGLLEDREHRVSRTGLTSSATTETGVNSGYFAGLLDTSFKIDSYTSSI